MMLKKFAALFSVLLCAVVLMTAMPQKAEAYSFDEFTEDILKITLNSVSMVKPEKAPYRRTADDMHKWYIKRNPVADIDTGDYYLNFFATDALTGKIITGPVSAQYFSPSSVNAFELYATSSDGKAGVLGKIPMNYVPEKVSKYMSSEHSFFRITRVPKDYKNPKAAVVEMDILRDFLGKNELIQWLKDNCSWIPDFIWNLGEKVIDKLWDYIPAYIREPIFNMGVPERFAEQRHISYQGTVLNAWVYYKDYSVTSPYDTKFWMEVRLERKDTKNLQVIVPRSYYENGYHLAVVLNDPKRAWDMRCTQTDPETATYTVDIIPTGSYTLVISKGEEKAYYPFTISGLAFPVTDKYWPDVDAFNALPAVEQEALKEADPDWYASNYQGGNGVRGWNSKDNDWTLATASQGEDGCLTVVNELATDGHILKLEDKEDNVQIIKNWRGEKSEYDTVAVRLFRWAGSDKIYFRGDIGENNRIFAAPAGKAAEDSSGNTLLYLKKDSMQVAEAADGGESWVASFHIPKDFFVSGMEYGLEEAEQYGDWQGDASFGTLYSPDDSDTGVIQSSAIILDNDKNAVTFYFRKVNENGTVIDSEPLEFILRGASGVGQGAAYAQIPVEKLNDGTNRFRMTLHRGSVYSLEETWAPSDYKAGAQWGISVSQDGTLDVIPLNSSAGEAKEEKNEGNIREYSLTDLFEEKQTVHIEKKWLDAAGREADPPENADAVLVKVRLVDNNRQGMGLEEKELRLTREKGWKDVYSVNPGVQSGDVRVYVTEESVLDENGSALDITGEWFPEKARGEMYPQAGSGDQTVTLANRRKSAGFIKMDGTEKATDYTFTDTKTGRTIEWDEERGEYPLDLSGYDGSEAVKLEERSKDGELVGTWTLNIGSDGLIVSGDFSLPDGTDPADYYRSHTEAKCNPNATVEGERRIVLYNPAESYKLDVAKYWDSEFVIADGSGNIQIDRRSENVQVLFSPVGTGSSLEDMEPLKSDGGIQPVMVTLYKDKYNGNVQLQQNVIYKMTEVMGEQEFACTPIYELISANGGTSEERTIPKTDGKNETVTSRDGLVITPADAGGKATITNNHDTFKVVLKVKADDEDTRPAYVHIQLQRREKDESGEEKWIIDRSYATIPQMNDRGIYQDQYEYTFTDTDLSREYRARVVVYASEDDNVPTKLCEENGTADCKKDNRELYERLEDGTNYSIVYDDARNASGREQIIELTQNDKLEAEIRWMDAGNKDSIRPEIGSVTLELLSGVKDDDGGTAWTAVTENGTPVTAAISGDDWEDKDGVGVGKAVFKLTHRDSGTTYRVRVKVSDDQRKDSIVRFTDVSEGSIYKESFEDSETAPVVTMTAQKEYSVEKKWDVDIENNDIPDKLQVILQKKPAKSEDDKDKDSEDKDDKKEDWGKPVQTLVLTKKEDWKGTFKPVDRYAFEEKEEDGTKKIEWKDEENTYRVRESKDAKLKGKLSELLSGLDDSAIDSLGLPDFVTDYIKEKIPSSEEAEEKVYDWACKQTEDTKVGGLVKSWLKDSVPEDGEKISLDVPERTSAVTGKQISEHKTTYKVSYKEDGNKTTITNLAVEDVTIWKRWVNIKVEDRPDHVYLVLTSKFDSDYSKFAEDSGIPFVGDFTPVFNPLDGDIIKIDAKIIEIKVPIAVGKAEPDEEEKKAKEAAQKGDEASAQSDDEEEKKDENKKPGWTVHFLVKKYGESGIPQNFKGAEMVSYLTSEVAKNTLGKLIGPLAKVFDYGGFNWIDKYLSLSFPAVRMPELIAQIGSSLGHDELEGLHSLVINSWINGKPSIGGTKTWKDESNADGSRPESIKIHIYEKDENGEKGEELEGSPVTASADTYWTWTFSSDKVDTKKEYVIEEKLVKKDGDNETEVDPAELGYEVKYDGYDITNTHVPEKSGKVNIEVTKVWEDDNVPEESVTVCVMAKGASVEEAELNKDCEWKHTFEGLDRYDEDGKEISYSLSEKENEDSGWNLVKIEKTKEAETEVDVKDEESGKTVKQKVLAVSYTVTNKVDTNKCVDYVVTKVWEPEETEHPDSVNITLKGSDGTEYEAEIKADGDEDFDDGEWTHRFSNLPKLDKEGNEIDYTLEEEEPEGFSAEISDPEETEKDGRITYTCTITNTREFSGAVVKVKKVWEPENSRHPDKVEVTLKGSDGSEQTAEITEDGSDDGAWTCRFEDLPYKDDDGNEITYTVEEGELEEGDNLDSFTSEVSDMESEEDDDTMVYSCTITNTRDDPEDGDVSLRIIKKWAEADREHPDSVRVTVNGSDGSRKSGTITESGDWAITFSGLKDADEDGNKITYTVSEKVPGYTGEVSDWTESKEDGKTIYTCTITNHDSIDHAEFVIEKKWDAGNAEIPDGIRVTVSGCGLDATVPVAKAGGWTYTVNDLPYRDESGKIIDYTSCKVTEEEVEGFTAKVSGITMSAEENGTVAVYRCTITNTAKSKAEKARFTVKKVWAQPNEKHPDSVTFVLKGSNGYESKEQTAKESNDWTVTFKDLDYQDKDGNKITYTVHETDDLSGYTVGYSRTTEKTEDNIVCYSCTVTNSINRKNPKASLKVVKEWDDQGAVYRPDSLTVYLMNGEKIVAEHTITASDNWQYTFKNLPINDSDGNQIQYTVSEKNITGYTPVFFGVDQETDQETGDIAYSTKILNKLPKTNTIMVIINKVWVGDEEDKRPDSVTMELSAEDISKTITLHKSKNSSDTWTTTLYVPLCNAQGKKYEWRLKEKVPEGYVCEISRDSQSDEKRITFTVTNTASDEIVPLTVKKVWNDAGHEAERPESVTLTVLQDGNEFASYKLTAPDWTARGTAQLYNASGKRYSYVLVEKEPDSRYTFTAVSDCSSDSIVLTGTNTYVDVSQRNARIEVEKTWTEADGGSRDHDPITLVIQADDEFYGYKMLKADENGEWTGGWDVPLCAPNGKTIAYTLTELAPAGYEYTVEAEKARQEGNQTVYSFKIQNKQTVYTVHYVLKAATRYGIPENLTAPADKQYLPGTVVAVEPAQTTSWTTDNGSSSGIPGYWYFTGWTRQDDEPSGIAAMSLEEDSDTETFTVTGDVTFIGTWTFVPNDPYDNIFVFHKEWRNVSGEHGTPKFILYNSDGTVRRGLNEQPKKTGDDEYTYWLKDADEYYVQEEPMEGYTASYENGGSHSDVDDRAYNGGKIINNGHSVPETGDHTPLEVLGLAAVLSAAGILILRKRRKNS